MDSNPVSKDHVMHIPGRPGAIHSEERLEVTFDDYIMLQTQARYLDRPTWSRFGGHFIIAREQIRPFVLAVIKYYRLQFPDFPHPEVPERFEPDFTEFLDDDDT